MTKELEKTPSKGHLFITPSKNNILSEEVTKQPHKTEIDIIIKSAENNIISKKPAYCKSKSLDLNMAQLEEIIKHHKNVLKDQTKKLNPIKELNDSSTAEDSSSMRNVTEFLPKNKIYNKIVNMKNNGIGCKSFSNLSQSYDKDQYKTFTAFKRNNEREKEREKEKEEEQTFKIDKNNYNTTNTNIKKEFLPSNRNSMYKPMTTFQNYQHNNTISMNSLGNNQNNKTNISGSNISFTGKSNLSKGIIPETTRNVINNYKRNACISFKACTLTNSNSLSDYSIKDFAKLKAIKTSLGASIQFPSRKNLK